MLDKILLVNKKEEAGLIVISRLISLMSFTAGITLLGIYFLTKESSYFMMGFFIMEALVGVHLIFALGLMIKIFRKSSLVKCLVSLFYIGMNFVLLEVYDSYFLSWAQF